jgi:hypothetical protein
MDVFAGGLELQYRFIHNDKPGTSVMDVTMKSELEILIKKLRVLSVSQVLPNGRKSSKALAPPMVWFEQAGEELEEQVKSTSSNKKVHFFASNIQILISTIGRW